MGKEPILINDPLNPIPNVKLICNFGLLYILGVLGSADLLTHP